MGIFLSPTDRQDLAADAAGIAALADALTSIAYDGNRSNGDRDAFLRLLRHAKNVAAYLNCLAQIHGDVSRICGLIICEARAVFVIWQTLHCGGLTNRLESHVRKAVRRLDDMATRGK